MLSWISRLFARRPRSTPPQPARKPTTPPYVVQQRHTCCPSIGVTVYWHSYKRKNFFQYWLN
jgi:hypothetical protein